MTIMNPSVKEKEGVSDRLSDFTNNPLRPLIEKMAARIAEAYRPEQIILYGSQATGKARPDSDIDFFIIKQTNDSFITRCAVIKKMVRDLRGETPFSPIVMTPEEIQKRLSRGDQFIEEILQIGIVLI